MQFFPEVPSQATRAAHAAQPMQDPRVNRGFSKALRAARFQFHSGQLDQFHETIALLSIREVGVSIVLANPELPDCPIIGVSDGFRKLTGYTRSEALGQNCRFLNYGCHMKADTRHSLRIAVRTGKTYVCVLTNRRRFGDKFENLFHMSSIRIGHKSYLVGVQADVTNSDMDLSNSSHIAELNMVVDRIFSENVNAWVSFQDNRFTMSRIGRPLPYTQVMLKQTYEAAQYQEACSQFVSLEGDLHQSVGQICTKNTFLEALEENDSREALCLLRKVSSEPILRSQRTFLGDEDELLGRVPELQQYQQQQYQNFLQVNRAHEPSEDGSNDSNQQYPSNKEEQLRQQLLQQEQKLQPKLAQPEQTMSMSDKSIGSMFHPDQCTPCSFFCYSLRGCNRGSQCEYCHEDHPRKARRRGRKKRRGKGGHGKDCDVESNDAQGEDGMSPGAADGDSDCEQWDQGQDVLKPMQPFQQDKDVDGMTHAPAPTPELLLPLLSALESLAPLPLPRLVPRETAGGAAFGEMATVEDFYQIQSADLRSNEKLTMWYHESTFVLEVGDEKHVIPFLNCNCDLQGPELEPLTFSVKPELPEGLRLDPASGVIKGRATKATESGCYSRHTVSASNSALTASTKVSIFVRARTASWCDIAASTRADLLTDTVWLASAETIA